MFKTRIFYDETELEIYLNERKIKEVWNRRANDDERRCNPTNDR